MSYTFFKAAAAAAVVLPLLALPVASQGVSEEEEAYRVSALAHARALGQAWRRLERHVLHDSAAAVSWTGDTPPAATGWRPEWTQRGLRARYCADTLVVYFEPTRLHGVDADQRAVQAAPAAYAGLRGGVPLHWLEGGVAEAVPGRAAVNLNAHACLTPSTLPSGRAALAGTVRDPFVNTHDVLTRETQTVACPSGEHGGGIMQIRELRQETDGRGNAVGSPAIGAWADLVDDCTADYTAEERVTQACSWNAGAPHNRTMHGQDVYRRTKTVTGPMVDPDGEGPLRPQPTVSYGAPVFVSTSCWTGTPPAAPVPSVTNVYTTETRAASCPSGWSGTASRSRTVTERQVRWPWDTASTSGWRYAAWVVDDSACVPPAPCAEATWNGTTWDSSLCPQQTAQNCRWETDNWVCPVDPSEGERGGIGVGGDASDGFGGTGGDGMDGAI